MSTCDYLIDISPYDPLCEHPCNLYGGGPVEADCNVCQYKEEETDQEAKEGDVHSYEEGYADGFDRGEEAIVQQIDGIVNDPDICSGSEAYEKVIDFINDFWKEHES